MGTWGTAIFDDDFAADIQIEFDEAIESGVTPEAAAEGVLAAYGDTGDDPDDGPILTLALASLLLDHGVHAHPILHKAREIVHNGVGLERWEEADETDLAERRTIYQQLENRLADAM